MPGCSSIPRRGGPPPPRRKPRIACPCCCPPMDRIAAALFRQLPV
jgi:hypothetical protein